VNPRIPEAVARDEKAHIRSRRRKFGVADGAPVLGVALSGGGIRSATVSLGVFQYLAREEKRARSAIAAPAPAAEVPPPPPRPLSRIDYLSSVSGGGYFGTFFGSLFVPKDERAKGAEITPEILPAVPRAPPAVPPKTKWEQAAKRAADVLDDTNFDGGRMTPLRWLRENGRYLAPTGGSDYLYAMAIAVRNFFALHYVIAVTLVAIFLLAALVRVLGFAYAPELWYGIVENAFLPDPGDNFWPSAWWLVAIAAFALLVVPVGVAFFLAQGERVRGRFRLNLPLITAIAIAALCFAYAITGEAPPLDWLPSWLHDIGPEAGPSLPADWENGRFAVLYIGVVAALSAAIYAIARLRARQRVLEGTQPPAGGATRKAGQRDKPKIEPAATTITRTRLSQALLAPLIVTLTLAAFALVDTIGQTVYALWTVGAHGKWLIGGGTIAVLIPLLKKLLPLVTGSGDPQTKAWVRVPMSALALVAGVALFVAVASLWSALTHGLIWGGERPAGDPGCVMTLSNEADQQDDGAQQLSAALRTHAAQRGVVGEGDDQTDNEDECEQGVAPVAPARWAWLFFPLLVIAVFTGHGVGFINLSSLQRYYAGHLMRSYLRASLFAEDPDVERDVRKAARADDITLGTYYHPSSLAPLHLINATLNQTVMSGSQLVQRDRKGMNVAIGPYGLAIGNRSFVKWDPQATDYERQRCPATVTGEPDPSALPRYEDGTRLVVEPLSIGNWCAISGAAFTTGHGQGTTLGLSLLLALTNVRMGYWWDAEVDPPRPAHAAPGASRFVEALATVFRTQSYLLNELFARYYGTRRSHWYLSDGGHFENTAVYELIRRRVPKIIVLDNGRDAEYAFDDLANLVRKARIDLDAEIEFLTSVELSAFVDASVRQYFGTPEEFKPDHTDPVYATLARVRYQDAPEGLLLVLKPRVAGIEPLDILNYKQASPDFPQQSTTDQFYDEAQWESYRGLGYWIAAQLFGERAPAAADKWVPRRMFE
jgi:hypothetical protein